MTLTHADSSNRAFTDGSSVRVATVPAGHAYVRHLAAVEGVTRPRIERLRDPLPTRDAGGPPWWPPAMLDPAWIDREHDTFDVLHVHFGFDALSPEDLVEMVDALRRHGKPLALTVHDLRNPHHRTRTLHDAQLDVLVPAADALVTLTEGAAHEVLSRWGRRPLVLPHPHVVDLDTMDRLAHSRPAPRVRGGEFRVGLHVKSLRACMDPWAVLPVLVRAVQEVPDGVLQVDGHTDVLDPSGDRFDASLAAALADAPDCVDVRVHDFFDDDALVRYLASLDLSVLPYRFGTHSGWLEACRDLGTPVAAPTCGHYADQGPVHSFVLEEDHFDEDSLVRAVVDAWDQVPFPAASVTLRRAERERLATAHAQLYADLGTA